MSSKCLIVCFDAGGAEIVSSWVRRHSENRYTFIVDGPALKIFKRKIHQFKNQNQSQSTKLIHETDWVLTGTGWSSNFEREIMRLGLKSKKKVVSFLDHWVVYRERFEEGGTFVLPDEIWVGDKDALNIAKEIFPIEKLKLEPNPYLEEIKEEIAAFDVVIRSSHNKVRILYVCEPIMDHTIAKYGDPNYWGYTEFSALRFFFLKLPQLYPISQIESVRLRLHPSESSGKYRSLLDENSAIQVHESRETSLIEDCVWSDWIVGCESMAIVVGLLAKKRVFSVIPPDGRKSALPHKEIVCFKDIEKIEI